MGRAGRGSVVKIDEEFFEDVTEIREAVARLDRAADLMPDPSVLINTVPLLEAQASSEIENILTTTDVLFRHGQVGDDATPPRRDPTMHLGRSDGAVDRCVVSRSTVAAGAPTGTSGRETPCLA